MLKPGMCEVKPIDNRDAHCQLIECVDGRFDLATDKLRRFKVVPEKAAEAMGWMHKFVTSDIMMGYSVEVL